ncbi:dead deah box helicase [Fusarium langsethiae]|uniref:Dead deah box helicase n=1 Tax=Fusarium langsethiae TaxID=179993 RepID=A0A0M9EQV0_FUSLA|nr:dead deah box helicase [Fusarium langsethiae]GKU07018.1 unnamed protein product [Fusarium langsethiae]
MQLRMADVVSYATSLTSSTGKTFNRETIVVGSQPKQSISTASKISQPKYHKQKPGKGGRQNAMLEAQKHNDQKAQAKLIDILNHWRDTCNEFEKADSPIDRYLKVLNFQSQGSSGNHDTVKPEIQLYLCHVLMGIWNQEILKALAATPLPINTLETPRALPFSIRPTVLRNVPELVKNTRLLQLEHGGPYMDRRFDSQPDARVQFEPDAWQRDVLDCIDANESILVVAPTSAGKTFISFYAMKKVLEESDDGVLVYVAPTKALVNQIAAEIEARFSKSYRKQTGKSIWAVHTRDYRINNPSQCQILVTVPHMLQIMLLSPTNAVSTNSWPRRVKRIIFDEVHCIGQADDGVVWEQLLLLAPCPIIALSATFTYELPKDFAFEGLSNSAQLPVPGLDEGGSIIQNFRFVHPVVVLKDRNRSVLDDVNLEARDCLRLWKHMRKTFPATLLPEIAKLYPTNVLPEWIEKQHVIEWEKDLKAVLRRAMKMENSPFPDLQESLKKMKSPDRPVALERHFKKLFPLVCDLHKLDALPALVFNYDRSECKQCVKHVLLEFTTAERNFKEKDQAWRQRVQSFDQWKKQKDSSRVPNRPKAIEDDNISKLDLAREEASEEVSRWESFNPEAPLDQFSLADVTSMQQSDFDGMVRSLNRGKVASWLIDALRRGLGVHHAGMNRRYRQIYGSRSSTCDDIGHLYFTENAVFAFHSLLRGGYFHALCEDIENAQERVLRELMLVLSHLFNRIPIKRTPKLAAIAARSSSEIFLRRLPEPAEKLLISHNQDVLSIFKDYVNSYINQHLGDKPDRQLPLTKVLVGPRKSCESSFMDGNQTVIRSPFAALSGFGDDFTTINELCSGVRGDVFLEESAISCIPIWPHDTDTEFNAYIYDFFKHGSMKVLVGDNHVKQGDVWFHLKDFSLVLKTIVTSLKGVMSAEGDYDQDDLDEDDTYMEESEVLLDEIQTQKPAEVTKETAKLPKKGKPVADSWDDDSEESEPDNTGSPAANTPGTSQSSVNRKGGLILVLKAFKLLEEEFGQKFYKIGA